MSACKDCRHYDDAQQKPGASDGERTGLCRWAAPIVTTLEGQFPWPFCKATDWCSRFTERPQ